MSRPPGPRLPSILQTAMYMYDPPRMLEWARRRYGPVFRLKITGFPAKVLVGTAELAEQVYALDAEHGRAGIVRHRLIGPMVGRHSLFSLDGDPWWRHRRMLGPPLHGRAIRGFGDRIAAIAAEEIDRWPVGRPFRLRDGMTRITLEVILRLAFGVRNTARLDSLRELLPRIIDVAGSPALLEIPPRVWAWADGSPLARRLPLLPSTRFLRMRDAMDEMLYAEISERRAAGPDPDATDMLSLLMAARDADGRGLSDRELRDELVTLLEAGHETSASGLTWAFERLLRNRHVLARLREELDADDGHAYLDAVVKETLRCRPVVFEASRLVDEPVRIGGHDVPPGVLATPSIYLINHDPDVFGDPREFRPERFLGEEGTRSSRSWMPFGGGRRYCLGAQFALLEMRVVLAEVLRRTEMTVPDPAPERSLMKHVTIVPGRQARVIITSRRMTGSSGTSEPSTAEANPTGRTATEPTTV
jgi:cytochrome P450